MAGVERGWFRQCPAREDVPDLYFTEADHDADFKDVEAADAEADLDTYQREIVAARTAVAGKASTAANQEVHTRLLIGTPEWPENCVMSDAEPPLTCQCLAVILREQGYPPALYGIGRRGKYQDQAFVLDQ